MKRVRAAAINCRTVWYAIHLEAHVKMANALVESVAAVATAETRVFAIPALMENVGTRFQIRHAGLYALEKMLATVVGFHTLEEGGCLDIVAPMSIATSALPCLPEPLAMQVDLA
jgi:hypothetical protein